MNWSRMCCIFNRYFCFVVVFSQLHVPVHPFCLMAAIVIALQSRPLYTATTVISFNIYDWWHIYASENWVNIASDNEVIVFCLFFVLSLQKANADVLSITLLGTHISQIWFAIRIFSVIWMHVKISVTWCGFCSSFKCWMPWHRQTYIISWLLVLDLTGKWYDQIIS